MDQGVRPDAGRHHRHRAYRGFQGAAVALTALAASSAIAQETVCKPLADVEASFKINGVALRWVGLTESQFHFLQGVYFEKPLTPPGLPRGSSAIMVETEEHTAATAYFLDGDQACAWISLNKDQLKTLMDVATGAQPEADGDPL